MNLALPQKVQHILSILNDRGHKAYAVGGCIRDSLLGKAPQDWDITTSAPPEEILSAFPKTVPTGLKHGTVTVLAGGESFEVTTFRIDGVYENHRSPESVTFTEDIREDLARRDFTVNAMAYHPGEGFVDPFGGRQDLSLGLLRAVGDPETRFDEDALRILRAFRFSAQTGFSIEENTLAAAAKMAPLLSSVSAERIRDELLKILLSDRPGILSQMDDLGVLPLILPEFSALRGVTQNTKYHVFDVFDHSLRVIENVPKTPVLRLAALLHDTGKPAKKTTDDKGTDHFYGHPAVSTTLAEAVLLRLKLDNKTIAQVKTLVAHHDYRFAETAHSVRKLASRVGQELFLPLLSLMRADAMGQNPALLSERLAHYERIEALYQTILADGDALSLADLAISGNDLLAAGYRGKEIGNALARALELVLLDPKENEKEILLKKLKNPD